MVYVLLVNTLIQINNLHNIDAVAGETTLDFYLRLYWYDNRLTCDAYIMESNEYTGSEGWN